MTFLILAIIFSTINHLLFRAFARFHINLLGAVVGNYLICVIIGYGSSAGSILPVSILTQEWFLFSIVQGGVFVACFLLIGRTTEKHGVAVASLATRLSVAIPAITAFFLYDDLATALKIAGIITALLALYLSCTNPKGLSQPSKKRIMFPISLFLVFGLHSLLLKFVQQKFLSNASYHIYVMSAFLFAFLISGSFLVWRLFKKKQTCKGRDLMSGLVLGCSNYGSIYFLIRALSVPGWQSSQLFPTISIAVIGLSSLGAWALFKEKLDQRMVLALTTGAGSIVLINF